MILPEGIYLLEELSIEKIRNLMEFNPGDIRLHTSSLDNLINILDSTGRAEESNQIRELIENPQRD